MDRLLIGADIGTSGLKAVLVDPEGGVIGVAERPYPMLRPHPGWTENDPHDWFDAVVWAVHRLLSEAGVPGSAVGGIAIVGQRDPVVLLDDNDQVLTPAIHWTDRRDPAGTAAVFDALGRERIIEVTGVRPTPGLVLPNLEWTRRNLPDVWRATRHLVQPKDYVLRRLTGARGTDVSSPSRSLLNDWRMDSWSAELCEAASIDASLLPPIEYQSSDAIGTLNREAAELLGLSMATVVAAGGGDDQAATLGSGVVRSGDISMGTGSSLAWRAVVDNPVVDMTGRVCIARHVVPGHFIYELIAVGSGTMLKWFRGILSGDDRDPAYEDLIAEAAAIPPGADGLFFYPYPDGASLPEDRPSARGTLLGINAGHRRGHVARAILEGVAYLYPPLLDILRDHGVEAGELVLIDGESRSPAWNQIKADVAGRSMRTTTVAEASAVGAAILAGSAAEVFSDPAAGAAAIVRPSAVFKPDQARHAIYTRLHEAWVRAAPHVFAAYDDAE